MDNVTALHPRHDDEPTLAVVTITADRLDVGDLLADPEALGGFAPVVRVWPPVPGMVAAAVLVADDRHRIRRWPADRLLTIAAPTDGQVDAAVEILARRPEA